MRGWAFGQTHQRYRLGNGDKREVRWNIAHRSSLSLSEGRTKFCRSPGVLGTSPPLPDRRSRSAWVIPFFAPKAARLSDERLHRCHRRRIAACPFVAGFSEGSTRRRVEKRCSKNVEVRAHLPPYSSSQA